MNNIKDELKQLLAQTGGVDSFTPSVAVMVMKKFIDTFKTMGLDENNTDDILKGLQKLFNLEIYNKPDFNNGKYVLTPNHVSEFDGPLFGMLHPNMIVMAKKSWTDDPMLNAFLGQFFKFVGVDRKDKASGVAALMGCIDHLNSSDNTAATIFVQQTIADINLIMPEDIAAGVLSIRKRTGASIIPVFCEQVSLDYPTRVVFGEKLDDSTSKNFGQNWLNAQHEMQKSLTNPPARKPILNEKHSTPISKREF